MEFEIVPKRNVLVFEPQINDFLERVLGVKAYNVLLTDKSILPDMHPFEGSETSQEFLDNRLRGSGPKNDELIQESIEALENFVPYSVWVDEIRNKTQELYGVTFEKYDPYLWEIGSIISRGNKSQ